MKEQKPNYSAMMQTLNIIHGALIMFPVIFAGVAVFINETNSMASEGLEILSYVAVGILIIAFPLSAFIFKSNIKNNVFEHSTLSQKIAAFQTAHLIRMSLFEVSGLFAAVATLQNGNYYNLIVLLVVIAMFFFLRPTPARIALDLGLSTSEKRELES